MLFCILQRCGLDLPEDIKAQHIGDQKNSYPSAIYHKKYLINRPTYDLLYLKIREVRKLHAETSSENAI